MSQVVTLEQLKKLAADKLSAGARVVAPVVPNAKKATSAQPTQTPNKQPTPTPVPVWRAVEPKATQAKVAPPIAETARVATEKGATFRKPEIH